MSQDSRLRRWRLILGGGPADGTAQNLERDDQVMDNALSALYDSERTAGLGPSCPHVPRWLGDIRRFFPTSIVQVMQRDALNRLNLTQMLFEPETLEALEPDVNLVATLMSLRGVLPTKTRESARIVVQRVVDELMRRLEQQTQQAITGALNRSARNRRPRHNEIDWNRTIRANLRHYLSEYKTIVPETRIGFGRRRASLRDIVLCIDQSGSMASSIVYSSVFGAAMASLPSVNTRLVVFDTEVVDLTDQLDDPVEVLFSTQLGGGTDINRAVAYCQSLIRVPTDTIFVLISDLYEGGVADELLKRALALVSSGVTCITLLALSDEGAPSYDAQLAAKLATIGVPSFACTPDKFPDLMAAAIERRDISLWAAQNEMITTRRE
ncbi:MAG: VWA domain-containing protein [Phycisphaerae bacterium]